ncbi:HAD-IA family hydrolase [Tistrella bauzanensis]
MAERAGDPMQTVVQTRPIDAVLLDMDGTILNSIKAAERIWQAWAERHGVDVATFLPTIHGVRAVETIRRVGLAGIDPEVEAAAITRAEIDDVEGIEAIAGVHDFLAGLPVQRWAIVTSAPRPLALRRIEAAGLQVPPLLIAAEDVETGKPAPDCFLLAAERLGTQAHRCLVIEDSMAGITAAERAGAAVLVVTTTHHTPMTVRHPAILDYRDLALNRLADGAISICHARETAPLSARLSCVLQAAGPARP